MAQRSERTVVPGDSVRLWGSTGPYRLVTGVGRLGGVVRFYLDGVDEPLVVGRDALLDVARQ